jgi:RHS repeat-associated protein
VATDQRGNGGQDVYNFAGRAIESIGPDGSIVKVSPLQSQTLVRPDLTADYKKVLMAFPLSSRVATYADGNGNVSAFTLDDKGQVVSERDSVGALPSVVRNSQDLVTQQTDARGHVTNYTYDAQGNLLTEKDELSGTPATSTLVHVGAGPSSVAVADVDGNGTPDLVSVNTTAGSLSVVPGNGDGTFLPSTDVHLEPPPSSSQLFTEPLNTSLTLPNGGDVYCIAKGDFNGDGKLDLAVTQRTYDPRFGNQYFVTVLLGNGDGTFQAPVNIAQIQGGATILAKDFDGDGKLDLLVDVGSQLDFFKGNGDGTFQAPVTIALSEPLDQIQVGDLRGNGKLDVVGINHNDNKVGVLLGNGNGTFGSETLYSVAAGPLDLAIADVNNDGKPDIVVGCYDSEKVSTLLNDGTGHFGAAINSSAQSPGNSGQINAIYVADFDGDGKVDVVAGRTYGNIIFMKGNGDGTFTVRPDLGDSQSFGLFLGRGGTENVAPDLTGNGKPDVVFTSHDSNEVIVGLNRGDGSFDYRTWVASPSLPGKPQDASRPAAVLAGDFNGDGLPDLVVASTEDFGEPGGLSILLSDTPGTFRGPQMYSLPKTTTYQGGGQTAVLGDFLGQGKLDLAVASNPDLVDVFPGNGDGTFGKPFAAIRGGAFLDINRDLKAVDLDGDGKLDVVWLGDYPNDVHVLAYAYGNGDGTFNLHTVQLQHGYAGLVVGDFNGDGLPDIAVATDDQNGNGYIEIYRNGGASHTLTLGTTIDLGAGFVNGVNGGLAAGDFTGDGKLDLIVHLPAHGSSPDKLEFFKGNGDGTFNDTVVIGSNLPNFGEFTTADLRGNGKLDLIGCGDAGVYVWLGNGDGTFKAPVSVGGGNQSVQVVDINGDGKLDLVSGSQFESPCTVILGNGDGTFQAPLSFAVGQGGFDAVVAGDLKGDGKPELVVGHNALGNSGNNFTVLSPAGSGLQGVATGDLRGNGKTDLVVADADTNRITVLPGKGDGTFPTHSSYAVGEGPGAVVLADVNGDHHLDAITANSTANTVSVMLGKGDSTFTSRHDFATGKTPVAVATGDLNRDGKLDLVTANAGDNTVSVLLGHGDGTFAARTDYAVGKHPVSVALADVNGDGIPDLVVANQGDNTVSVLLGNGDGTFGHRTDYAIGHRPTSVAVGDIEGNGKPDIVVAMPDVTSVWLLHNNGDGTFAAPKQINVANHPGFVTLSDMDLDGTLDIVTTDATNGTVAVLLNTPASAGFAGTGQRTMTYDPVFNQMTSETDELGRKTLYQIDPANGNVLSVTQVVGAGGPNDVVAHYTYTPQGLVSTMTDPLGRVTQYDYDKLGRLTTITLAKGTPDQGIQRFEYDAAGNVTARIDENGHRTEYQHDAMNRNVLIRDPLGNVTRFTYDLAGNLISTTDARDNVTQTQYDTMNRPTKMIDANGGTSLTRYDLAGNVIATVDELGHATQDRYDARNRLVEMIDPSGAITQYRYDLDNNRTSVIDPDGNQTNFVYDARNRMAREIDPLGQIKVYVYNAADDLVQTTDRDGRKIQYAYDDLDRLTTETWVGTSEVIHSSYDKASNLTAITDAFSALAYTYDNRDRVKTVDNGGTPNAPHVVLAYTYDPTGNVLTTTDTINGQTGGTNAYTYDPRNLMTQVTQSGNGVHDKRVNLTYNEVGQFASISRFADLAGTQQVVSTSYTYDALDRLTNLTHRNASTTVASYQYTFDAATRITKIVSNDGTTTYTYDNRDQLLTANSTDPAIPRESYAYDPNGNRTSMAGTSSGYVIGKDNRLMSDGTFNYVYDKQGNLIRRTEIATGKVREFQWDDRNRLTAVIDKDPNGNITQQVTCTYDALDRRISETVGSTVTYFVYDGSNILLAFVDSDGPTGPNPTVLTERYLLGPAVDQVFAQDDGHGNVLWQLTDHEGTVRDLVNSSGLVVNHIKYDSYGNIVSQSDAGLVSQFLYTGRDFDPATGLYFFRARYYAPTIGRFLSEDPIEFFAGDPNLYRYVGNEPVMGTDPTGLRRDLPRQCKPGETCAELAAKRAAFAAEFAKRLLEWTADRKDIKGLRDPRKYNPKSVQTHYHLLVYTSQQALECHKLYVAQKCGCPPPPPVVPVPSLPPRPVPVPVPASPRLVDPKVGAYTLVIVGTGYLLYRGVRLLPSLAPPLWWTLPTNLVIP